jgi:hypothetical protein
VLLADLLQFLFLWALASLLVRYAQTHLSSDSDTGKALAYLYH